MENSLIKVPDVTVVICDTIKYGDAIHAIQKTLEQIEPAEVIFFTDINFPADYYRTEIIPHLYSKEDYSKFMIKELGKYEFKTSHILVIQWDGFVLNAEQWDNTFLEYDYLGATWPGEVDGMNCGNGGFSLRSVWLQQNLANDPMIKGLHPEDANICRLYRDYLQQTHNIKFAPEHIADKFSFELKEPMWPTFGFHGRFHKPYIKEPIVFRRSAALGDILALEPVMAHFHELGHPIILDAPYHMMFSRHFYPVKDYKQFDHQKIKHRVIDFDRGYEVNPKQLHLKSYFEIAGVKDYELRNPRLRYDVDDNNRLFKKYVVLHIDERETSHRNLHGIKWNKIKDFFEEQGLTIIQIGKNKHTQVGLEFNTVNELLLMWLIRGCELFLGVDSGPACIAVALDRKCVISFGSVNPAYIHPDLSKVAVLQSNCPIDKNHCWHSTTSTRGSDCEVDIDLPPCTVVDTYKMIEAIKKML